MRKNYANRLTNHPRISNKYDHDDADLHRLMTKRLLNHFRVLLAKPIALKGLEQYRIIKQ